MNFQYIKDAFMSKKVLNGAKGFGSAGSLLAGVAGLSGASDAAKSGIGITNGAMGILTNSLGLYQMYKGGNRGDSTGMKVVKGINGVLGGLSGAAGLVTGIAGAFGGKRTAGWSKMAGGILNAAKGVDGMVQSGMQFYRDRDMLKLVMGGVGGLLGIGGGIANSFAGFRQGKAIPENESDEDKNKREKNLSAANTAASILSIGSGFWGMLGSYIDAPREGAAAGGVPALAGAVAEAHHPAGGVANPAGAVVANPAGAVEVNQEEANQEEANQEEANQEEANQEEANQEEANQEEVNQEGEEAVAPGPEGEEAVAPGPEEAAAGEPAPV